MDEANGQPKLACKIGHSGPLTTAKPDQFRQARWRGRPLSKGRTERSYLKNATLIGAREHRAAGILLSRQKYRLHQEP
jgi:hypothetical protein